MTEAASVSRAEPRHPFLEWPGPVPFAHRGGALDHPENTMAAFRDAHRLGYRHIETDALVTADGAVMAFHDDRLDRCTDRTGLIERLPLREVEAADAGHTFSLDGGASFPQRGRGIRVPRLEHLLEELPDVRVNIDPKSDAALEPVISLIERMDAFDRCCIGSFSGQRLRRARALGGPRLCTSMGPASVTVARLASLVGRLPAMGARCLQIPTRGYGIPLVDRRLVEAAHRNGLAVHVWVVDDAAEMERLLDLGVDGLMTDRPLVLREVMRGRGLWFVESEA